MKGRTVEEIQEEEFLKNLITDASNFMIHKLIAFLAGKNDKGI